MDDLVVPPWQTRARPPFPSRPFYKAVPPHGRTDRPAWATTAIHDRSWRGGNPRMLGLQWDNININGSLMGNNGDIFHVLNG